MHPDMRRLTHTCVSTSNSRQNGEAPDMHVISPRARLLGVLFKHGAAKQLESSTLSQHISWHLALNTAIAQDCSGFMCIGEFT